ncbi:MAG: response regulator, partial [Elusimicrobia bacterium]|nr:response regulator [Elusimicrobiota bacterium]
PDLILLDLKMPRMGGFRFLEAIKQDTQLKQIPVAVLTTSESQEDVARTYDLQAHCFITKPVDLEGFIRVAETIENFWTGLMKVPREARG